MSLVLDSSFIFALMSLIHLSCLSNHITMYDINFVYRNNAGFEGKKQNQLQKNEHDLGKTEKFLEWKCGSANMHVELSLDLGLSPLKQLERTVKSFNRI